MSESHLYARALTRGINDRLVAQGAIRYSSKLAQDASADYVAIHSRLPDPSTAAGAEAITLKVAGIVADNLVAMANYDVSHNGYDVQVTKTAASTDPESLALVSAQMLMEKVASEMSGGTLPDAVAPNDLSEAAQHSEVAARENKERGVGYAEKAEGDTALTDGKLVDEGIPAVKSAMSTDGALLDDKPGQKNTPANAAKNSETAKKENKERPEGYAEKAQTLDSAVTPPMVGTEVKQAAFNQILQGTAAEVGPYLPAQMAANAKLAHVRRMIGLTRDERAEYLGEFYKMAGIKEATVAQIVAHYRAKVAEEDEKMDPDTEGLPPALRANAEKKKDEKEEKDDDDDDKDDDDKDEVPAFLNKNASLAHALALLDA